MRASPVVACTGSVLPSHYSRDYLRLQNGNRCAIADPGKLKRLPGQSMRLAWFIEAGELSAAEDVLYDSNQHLSFPERLLALTPDSRRIVPRAVTLSQPGSLTEHRCKESASL